LQESSPTIGAYPGYSDWGYGEEEVIKDAVHRKASRYGELDRPYLICINAFTRLGITTTGVENALLGTVVGQDSSCIDETGFRGKRAKNGVFYSESGPTKTRVSGIFVTNVFPSNIDVAPHWLVKHPCGKMDLDFAQVRLSRLEFKSECWQPIEGQSIGEILKD
jgi:hypothetical protein